jgi:nucleoside 2-deoxyribosyltransferase
MSRTIYLANAYGFSAQARDLLTPIIEALESLGLEVWEPFKRNDQADFSQPGTAYEVAMQDRRDVEQADGFFAIVNGNPPDEGVMIELGIAIALNKPIFLFRDDFRRCTDSDDYPLNLMLFCGLPKEGWRDFYYESVDSLTDPDRSLAKWAKTT